MKEFVSLWNTYTHEFTELLCSENGKPVSIDSARFAMQD